MAFETSAFIIAVPRWFNAFCRSVVLEISPIFIIEVVIQLEAAVESALEALCKQAFPIFVLVVASDEKIWRRGVCA